MTDFVQWEGFQGRIWKEEVIERDVQHPFQYVQPELRNTVQPVLAAVDAAAGIEHEE